MKKLIIGALALSLIAAPAFAAPGHDNHDSHQNDHNNGHDNNSRNDNHADQHKDDHTTASHAVHHGWKSGQKLPSQWQHGHDVDWHAHHLRQPPRGYHWVQTDGDYVLAAIATGVIMSAIAANQ